MICPNCKNEKWDADTCPQCGLDGKTALLSLADTLRKAGKWRQAAETYDKYLALAPGVKDVKRRKASCLCQAAATSDPALFDMAGVFLGQLLEEDWDWEEGHLLRMDLFYHFGKLDVLLNEYQQTGFRNENRKAYCDQMIRVIRLTDQFRKNPPVVHTSLEGEGGRLSWLKKYWPLVIGLPLVVLAVVKVSTTPHSKDEGNFLFLFLAYVILGLIVLVLFFATMQLSKGGKKTLSGDKKIGPANRS